MNNSIPLNITAEALEEVKKIFKTKNIPSNYGLRIGIKGSTGCAGANFVIGFDTEEKDDSCFLLNEVKVIIKKGHYLYLAGQKVDYISNNEEQGFVFSKEI